MSDWNWFFSALAQSTAAIVGIFGAFIFTKIINNQREFNSQKLHSRGLKENAERFKKRAEKSRIGSYVGYYLRSERLLRVEYFNESSSETLYNDLCMNFEFPDFIEKDKLLKIIEKKKEDMKKSFFEITSEVFNIVINNLSLHVLTLI